MRNLLILGGIGMLSTAAWTVIADDGASGYGSKHARPGHGGLEYHMRHGGGHFATAGQLGMFFPTPPELFPWESEPGPAPGMPTGGLVAGRSEHMIAGHPVGPAIHPLTHVTVQVERGEAVIPQPTAPSTAESDQAGAATAMAQPNPTASPLQPRPPGAGGDGDGDGAAESHRQPIAAASSRRRRPGSAGVRVVQPRVARTRTTAKSSTVRRVFPSRSSGDHFPFSVWKRTLTAISARNRS